jgi:hypothetical protein
MPPGSRGDQHIGPTMILAVVAGLLIPAQIAVVPSSLAPETG